MALLKIYRFPDRVLAEKALPIPRVEKSYHRLADDMLETMYDAPGVGLAANQVGILERILVIDVDFELEDPENEDPENQESEIIKNKNPRIVINPEITYTEGSILYKEGCLSVPKFTAEVKRYEKIKLTYRDIDGLTHTLAADGLLAVAIQHEIDHLNGRLFIELLSPLKKETIKRKLKQSRRQEEREEELEEEEEVRVGGSVHINRPAATPKLKTKKSKEF